MAFYEKIITPPESPNLGDFKAKRKFLWLPKTLHILGTDIVQTRWLGFEYIVYRYSRVEMISYSCRPYFIKEWTPFAWE